MCSENRYKNVARIEIAGAIDGLTPLSPNGVVIYGRSYATLRGMSRNEKIDVTEEMVDAAVEAFYDASDFYADGPVSMPRRVAEQMIRSAIQARHVHRERPSIDAEKDLQPLL